MYLDILILIIGLVILLKGADILVSGSSRLAKHYHISPFIIGMTIVAFGTSLPELVVSFIALSEGSSGITIGNIIGSNIANIGLVLGISALIIPLAIKDRVIKMEIPFMILASLVLFVLVEGGISRIDGILMLAIFFALFYFTFREEKKSSPFGKQITQQIKNKISVRKYILLILLGLGGVVLGGKMLVDSAVQIAQILGISDTIIGITIIAVGTSLPELIVSLVAAVKKHTEISVGNIIGSNLFNILFVLGLSSLFMPISVDPSIMADMLVMIFFSVLTFFLFFNGNRKMDRYEGFVVFVFYVMYIAHILSTVII